MTTKDRIDLSRQYFLAGYNCAQSVVASFADVMNLDEQAALKLSSSFGGGVGRLREICGAVSGIAMVAGALHGDIDPANPDTKAAHYALIQRLAKEFEEKHGSLICRDLLEKAETSPCPDARTAEYYAERPCLALVEDATRIICDLIEAQVRKQPHKKSGK